MVNNLDANLPVSYMKTLEAQQEESLITERLVATLSTAFGILATLLAAIGLYGVMAYMVAQRTREIGVRMALGAARSDVVWLVMKEVVLLAGIGIAIGLPAAYGLTRFAKSQLYGIQPNDAVTIALATAAIAIVAIGFGLHSGSQGDHGRSDAGVCGGSSHVAHASACCVETHLDTSRAPEKASAKVPTRHAGVRAPQLKSIPTPVPAFRTAGR